MQESVYEGRFLSGRRPDCFIASLNQRVFSRSRRLRTDIRKSVNMRVTVASPPFGPNVPYTPRICPFRPTSFVVTPGTGRLTTWTRTLCRLPGFRSVTRLGPGKGPRYASFQPTSYSQSKTGTPPPDRILEREREAADQEHSRPSWQTRRQQTRKELACQHLTRSN